MSITEEYIQQLKTESGITEQVVIKANLKFSKEGINFPYIDEKGSLLGHRTRLSSPKINKNGKQQRYTQKKNIPLKGYFLEQDRLKIFNSKQDLYVTEGEKKLLSFVSVSDDKPVIAFPGCQNWVEKESSGKLSSIWKKIPYQERNIILLTDTDFFFNINVFNAICNFIREVTLLGATVQLVDLRNEEDKSKIGLDDYIVSNGYTNLLKRINDPLWSFTSLRPIDYKPLLKDQISKSLVILSPNTQESYFDEVNNLSIKIDKTTIRKRVREYKKEWNKYKPLPLHKNGEVTWFSTKTPIKSLCEDLVREMRNVTNLYRNSSSNSFVFINEKGLPLYCFTPHEISLLLSSHIKYRRASYNKDNEVRFYEFEHIPEKHLGAIRNNSILLNEFKELLLVTKVPQLISNRLIKDYGYDIESKIFYSGSPIKEIKGLTRTSELFSSFPLESKVDFINIIGLITSMFLVENFKGEHPAIIIKGDHQDLGKSTLAKVLSIIFQEKYPVTISLDKDQELGKIIPGILKENNTVLIDNIKQPIGSIVSSPLLEASITAPTLEFRALGKNAILSRPNNILFIFSINSGSFSNDLLTRSVCISLTNKKNNINHSFSPIEYCIKHRDEILNEISFLLLNYLKKTDCKQNKPINYKFFKFNKWANKVHQILTANDISDFLSNQNKIKSRIDPLLNAIMNKLESTLDQRNTNSVTLEANQIALLLPDIAFEENISLINKSQKVGRILTSEYDFISKERNLSIVPTKNTKKGSKSTKYIVSRINGEQGGLYE